MSLTISIRTKLNGSLVDADATPTLTDAAAAFGIKRVSDGVSVVAAGTAMTRQSLGTYTYAFESAVAGVVYQWSAKAVIGGINYYKAESVVLATAASSSSYLTTTEADAIAATLPNLTNYLAAGGSVKAAALELASMRIDNLRYQGRKYDPDQVLEFPRVPYGTTHTWPGNPGSADWSADSIWDWDKTNNVAIVPTRVKRAVLFEAESILSADNDRITKAIASGIVSQSTGSLSETYRQNGGGGFKAWDLLCAESKAMLERYRLRTGAML